ncbi:LpxI family protein [Paragemmobacter straminiformis]|uniref:UDP-2,3-diacylglucosamine diphosphatase LpxI n=1 Tax=Paragemmobacter straminiformis TaxID=2045119 RepID=A0A842I638_9RHOB|nr:UDP-2,3-diacylglucosamine diphosphatase LpxI [Gemmobacter straminiformis]MBC2835310.1 UDP-2,3-diacylglucosamine diphosphatase LpxI [Gemmobacter straminiformis]
MTLALIAGAGGLPAALVAALPQRPFVAVLDGFAPEGVAPDVTFRVERLMPFLRQLEDAGVTAVCFAGAVQRPRLDPALFDPATATIVPRLLAAMGQGDDATLREVIAVFEEAGFAIRGVAEIAPALVPAAGLYAGAMGPRDEADAARAATIVAALGRVDVGQGAVVQQGLCLGVETLSGTDAMLASVAGLSGLRPAGAKGLFYKAPKPLQDRRIDLPTLGPDTVRNVAGAGLGGIVWEAGGVITLDLPAMVREADERGLFLCARPA